MVRSFQVSAVFPNLTVLENVRVALQRPLGTSFHFWKSDRTLQALHGAGPGAAGGRRPRRPTATRWRWSCPTAASGRWSWPPPWRSIPRCCCSTSRPQGMGHEDVGRVVELIRRVAAEAHRPHGRAQPLGGGRPLPHHHRAAAGQPSSPRGPTPRSRPTPRCSRPTSGCRSDRPGRRRRRSSCCGSPTCTPSTASRTSSTAWTSGWTAASW